MDERGAGVDVIGRKMEVEKLKLKAFPVEGPRFSAPCEVVGTEGVDPFGGVIAEKVNKSDKCVLGGGPSVNVRSSEDSSGPLKTVKGRGVGSVTSISFSILFSASSVSVSSSSIR